MFASAPDSFFTKAFEAAVVFSKGDDGAVSASWKQAGRDYPLKRFVRETPAAEALQSCTGDYFSEELRTLYQLSLRAGKLMLRYPRGTLEMKPTTHDVFEAGFPVGVVTLHRNAGGACDGFGITTARARNLRFTRVKLTPAG